MVDLVLFDVVETLFSLEPVRRRLDDAGAGAGALELWFARFLRDGFAIAASGGYRPFVEVARSSLGGLLSSRGLPSQPQLVEHILAALGELEPHPDARPALERLRSEGLRAMTLTNGSRETTERLLVRSDLRGLFEATLSVEAVRAWKPRPEPYRQACAEAGVEPQRTALVAVHSWDVQGAASAGLRTGWCSRLEGTFPGALTSPTVCGSTLVEVVEQLVQPPPAT